MNKRIQELAEQAGFYYTDKTGFITPAGCDPAKFAELIVRECARVARQHTLERYTGMSQDYQGIVLVEKAIRDHFGVDTES